MPSARTCQCCTSRGGWKKANEQDLTPPCQLTVNKLLSEDIFGARACASTTCNVLHWAFWNCQRSVKGSYVNAACFNERSARNSKTSPLFVGCFFFLPIAVLQTNLKKKMADVSLNEEICLSVPPLKLLCYLHARCQSNCINWSQLHFSEVYWHINKGFTKAYSQTLQLHARVCVHIRCSGTFQDCEIKVKCCCRISD